MLKNKAKPILFFLSSAFITSLLTSIVSSQVIVADLQRFGIAVPITERLSITMKDIVGLGPALFLLIALSFMFAFIIAKYCHQYIGGRRDFWYLLAGFTSFPCTLYLIKVFMGITLLASARTFYGMLLVASCCMVGGLIFSRLTTAKEEQ